MKEYEAPNDLKPVTPRFSINLNKKYGEGCYGFVYEGYDHQEKQVIAIKHLKTPEDFKEEVETLKKLCTLKHPNIMGFFGFQVDSNDVYLFVESCPGGCLTDLINKGIEEEEVLDLFRQLVQGMCYMNAKSKMHRDLKPDNILIGKNRDIKISDFGLSRDNDGLDVTGVVGTPLYAGPEVYTNYIDSYSDNCDVWGAGLILYEMLMGKHPLGHVKTMEDLKKEWKLYERGEKRISYPKDLHPQWEFITNMMLTHNPKKRPTFHEILEILKKVDDNGPMRKEIRNKKEGKTSVSQNAADQYLSFLDRKMDLLVELEPKIVGKNYPHIKEGLKYILVFLAAARYHAKAKKMIRSLKFKTLKYPNQKEVLADPNAALVVENYRMIFETKFTKIQNYIEEKIVPEIIKLMEKPEEKQATTGIQNAYNLVLEVRDGSFDIEDTYFEQYQKVLSFHRVKATDEKIKAMPLEEQEAYFHIILLGFLDTEFQDIEFMKPDYINKKLSKISKANPEELQRHVTKLKGFLK